MTKEILLSSKFPRETTWKSSMFLLSKFGCPQRSRCWIQITKNCCAFSPATSCWENLCGSFESCCLTARIFLSLSNVAVRVIVSLGFCFLADVLLARNHGKDQVSTRGAVIICRQRWKILMATPRVKNFWWGVFKLDSCCHTGRRASNS